IEQPGHDLLGPRIVARDREGDPSSRPLGLAPLQQMAGVDVVERLHDRTAELVGHPAGLGGAALDRIDPAVALAGVVVPGVHHDHAVGDALEEIAGQSGDVLERDADDDDVARAGRLLDGDRPGAAFPGERGEALGTATVGDADLMSQGREPAGQRAADVARADDADLHGSSQWVLRGNPRSSHGVPRGAGESGGTGPLFDTGGAGRSRTRSLPWPNAKSAATSTTCPSRSSPPAGLTPSTASNAPSTRWPRSASTAAARSSGTGSRRTAPSTAAPTAPGRRV